MCCVNNCEDYCMDCFLGLINDIWLNSPSNLCAILVELGDCVIGFYSVRYATTTKVVK